MLNIAILIKDQNLILGSGDEQFLVSGEVSVYLISESRLTQ